jgi:hypothetical protein
VTGFEQLNDEPSGDEPVPPVTNTVDMLPAYRVEPIPSLLLRP